MKIQHLRHNQIDQIRWDDIITNSLNQFGYAYSWYLNIVSPNWEALVSDNYDFIMPLPVKKKFRITYMVQPDRAQQLGIFSGKEITDKIVKLFIDKIPYYSYQINLNENNFCSSENQDLIAHQNFVLNLNQNFKDIQSKFSKNTNRNINKAHKADLNIGFSLDATEFINFYFSINTDSNLGEILEIEKLIKKGFEQDLIQIPVIRNKDGNIIAGFCLLNSKNRMIYLVPVSSTEGKKNSAMFLLLNEIIKTNSQKELVLDFEGSIVEGIARFYRGFGAKNKPYYILKKLRPDFLVGRI